MVIYNLSLYPTGPSETPPHDAERDGPVPRAAPVVPERARHAGTLPRAPHPAGVGRRGRRHAHRVRGQPRHGAATSEHRHRVHVGLAAFM